MAKSKDKKIFGSNKIDSIINKIDENNSLVSRLIDIYSTESDERIKIKLDKIITLLAGDDIDDDNDDGKRSSGSDSSLSSRDNITNKNSIRLKAIADAVISIDNKLYRYFEKGLSQDKDEQLAFMGAFARQSNNNRNDDDDDDSNDDNSKKNRNKKSTSKLAWQEGIGELSNLLVEAFRKWKEIDESIYETGRKIGFSSRDLEGYQQHILKNYDELASKLGMTFKDLFKFQEKYTQATGRAIILTNNEVEYMATMAKMAGDVATDEMVKNMDDFGASTQTATDYLAINMYRARSAGLDAQKASEAFAKNIDLASKLTFRNGIDGISKMTMLSQKLKFNMDSIANAAEKFETVEGAISTSANLQMLGGSYASQFGNPLEAMNLSLVDPEAFTQKIVDTFANKAFMNHETGVVEMSQLDKRFLKEAAKNLGISYKDAWNMATQQAKVADIEKNLSGRFTDEEKAFISSKANFDRTDQQYKITYFDKNTNEQKTARINELTPELLSQIKEQAVPEKDIQANVRGIHQLLKERLGKDFKESKSWNETLTGLDESVKINGANIMDFGLNGYGFLKDYGLKDAFSFLADGNWWKTYLTFYLTKTVFKKTIGSNIMDRIKGNNPKKGGKGNSGGGGSTPKPNATPSGGGNGGNRGGGANPNPNPTNPNANPNNTPSGGGNGGNRGGGANPNPNPTNPNANPSGGNSRNRGGNGKTKWGTKISKFFKGNAGKWMKRGGKAAIVAGAIYGAYELASNMFSSGEEEKPSSEPIKSDELKSAPDKIKDSIVQELKAQTILLNQINDKMSVGHSLSSSGVTTNSAKPRILTVNKLPETNQASIFNSSLLESTNISNNEIDDSLFRSVGGTITGLSMIGGARKLAAVPAKKIAGKSGLKMIGRLGVGAKLTSPLGWTGLGLDFGNELAKGTGLWEENSHADKLAKIGSKGLEYASIGGTIGSIIPGLGTSIGAGIGGAVGTTIGVIENYGDSIKKFFGFGDNKKNNTINVGNQNNSKNLFGINNRNANMTTNVNDYNFNELIERSLGVQNNNIGYSKENEKLLASIEHPSISPLGISKPELSIKEQYHNSITPIPTVGKPTFIRRNDENLITRNESVNKTENINLNINGSLRLIGDKETANIDIKKLIENPQFKNQILDMIKDGLSERSQGASRFEKNSLSYMRNGSFDRNAINGNSTIF